MTYYEASPRNGFVLTRQTARFGPIGMEQVWSRAGATGGKRSARQSTKNELN
jgi:hypothetical protein